MWHVYIILCSDNSFYTGITTDIGRRINEHNSGKAASYTRGRRPVKLFYQESCRSRSEALKREFQIKSLSQKEKIALIGRVYLMDARIKAKPVIPLCFDLYTAFQQKVLRAVAAIPRGGVSTYQLIAKQIGKPKSTRVVGMVLANNPFPIAIPCHRVICSDGTLGGYQGGLRMKRTLLRMEKLP